MHFLPAATCHPNKAGSSLVVMLLRFSLVLALNNALCCTEPLCEMGSCINMNEPVKTGSMALLQKTMTRKRAPLPPELLEEAETTEEARAETKAVARVVGEAANATKGTPLLLQAHAHMGRLSVSDLDVASESIGQGPVNQFRHGHEQGRGKEVITGNNPSVDATLYTSNGAVAFCCISIVLAYFMLRSCQSPAQPPEIAAAQLMRVTTGAEIQKMFDKDSEASKSSGLLLRVQGHIISSPEETICAPLSARPCVAYSASMASRRKDGSRNKPSAFHSFANDFYLELGEEPQVKIAVQGKDVRLFNMATERNSSTSFGDAASTWRSFVMAHLSPEADAASLPLCQGSDTNGDQGLLEFSESALLPSSFVTCIGEVARGEHGGLVMRPWCPSSVAATAPMKSSDGTNGSGKGIGAHPLLSALTVTKLAENARRVTRKPRQPPLLPLSGHVMISDDPILLDAAVHSMLQLASISGQAVP